MDKVGVTVAPAFPALEDAVRRAGARIVPASEADAVIWVNPRDPDGLRHMLEESPARWVQLPFAGIESFFEAGVIDPARVWTCAKGIYGHATAEHALTLMLAAARLIPRHARERAWPAPGEPRPHRRLAGSTVLIVGTGGIGRALGSMLMPLGARVLAVNRSGAAMPGAERTARVSDLDTLLPEADWVVIAAALTSETAGLFGAALLARMRPDAWLVNVARGGLVRTDDLLDALRAGAIAGAALDVTDPEPLPADHPLWGLDNVIITPHVANTAEMAIPELAGMIERNIGHWRDGEPLEGLVDPSLGY